MSNTIAVIVEGQRYEIGVFNSFQKYVMSTLGNSVPKVISLPAEANIYMLWKKFSEDEDVDIIEIVRESSAEAAKQLNGYTRNDFSEIFLFFDFDAHQDNLTSNENPNTVVRQMLETFSNETENGKLYISYPMAESIRDNLPDSCEAFSGNCCILYQVENYKQLSGKDNPNTGVTRYKKENWKTVIACFKNRLSRLFEQPLTYSDCKQKNPLRVYEQQTKMINDRSQIVIISAFPEFFIDYYKIEVIEEYLESYDIICPGACFDE